MHKSMQVSHRRLSISRFLVLSLLSSGCGGAADRGDTASPDTSRARANAAAQSSSPATLPPKLYAERPSSDPQRWLDFVEDLAFSAQQGMTLDRGCADDHTQHGDCRLVISPALHSQLVGPANIDPFGYVVARIQNVGSKKEAFFGIEPGQIVLWRVFRRSQASSTGQQPFGQMASQFIDLRTGQPIARPTNIPSTATYFDVPPNYGGDEFPFRECGGNHQPSKFPRAWFVPCDLSFNVHLLDSLEAIPPAQRSRADLKALLEARKPLNQHNSPAWIACLQGCCTVEEGP